MMSAVRAARSISTEPEAPVADQQAMLDVLYDILATGIDSEQSDAPVDEIETFLFEHARAGKSRDEFRAFFAKLGLSLRMRLVQAPAELALPPIERAKPVDPPMQQSLPVELAGTPFERIEKFADPFVPAAGIASVSLAAAIPARSRFGTLATWTALACLAGGLAFVALRGYETILQLRAQVARTEQQGKRDREALDSLRDDAAYLQSSVAATGALVQRVDEKSDMVLDALLTRPPVAPQHTPHKAHEALPSRSGTE